MINIRQVSDLKNKYPKIEDLVLKEDEANNPNTRRYSYEK